MPTLEVALEAPAETAVACLFPVAPDTSLQTVRETIFSGVEVAGRVWSSDGRVEAWHLRLRAGNVARVVHHFDQGGPGLPDAAFAARPHRLDTVSPALATQVARVAPHGPVCARAPAIIQWVADRFCYDKGGTSYGDGELAAPALADGPKAGTCVDMHTAAVAALRAAGIEAAYVIGVHVPEGRDSQRTGHCWINLRAHGVPTHWDISHHVQYGVSTITPAENPRPGRRFALGHTRAPVFDTPDGPLEIGPALNGFHLIEGPQRGLKAPTLARFPD
jgi:Transglutaminase-like superfamily